MIKYFLFFRAYKTLPIFRRFFKQKFFRHNMGCGNLVFRSGDCSVSFMTMYDDANELFKYFLVLKLSSFSITTPWSQYTRETKNMFSHYFKLLHKYRLQVHFDHLINVKHQTSCHSVLFPPTYYLKILSTSFEYLTGKMFILFYTLFRDASCVVSDYI